MYCYSSITNGIFCSQSKELFTVQSFQTHLSLMLLTWSVVSWSQTEPLLFLLSLFLFLKYLVQSVHIEHLPISLHHPGNCWSGESQLENGLLSQFIETFQLLCRLEAFSILSFQNSRSVPVSENTHNCSQKMSSLQTLQVRTYFAIFLSPGAWPVWHYSKTCFVCGPVC